MAVKRTELADMVAVREADAGITPEIANRVIGTFLRLIELNVACGEEVRLYGFGNFYPRQLSARTRKVPVQPGLRKIREVEVPERTTMAFVCAPVLRQRLTESVSVPEAGTAS